MNKKIEILKGIDFNNLNDEGLKKLLVEKFSKNIKTRNWIKMEVHHAHIEQNQQHYNNLLKMHNHLQQAKHVLINVLNFKNYVICFIKELFFKN